MQSKILIKCSLFTISMGLIFFSTIILSRTLDISVQGFSAPPRLQSSSKDKLQGLIKTQVNFSDYKVTVVPIGIPVRLKIPKLNIDTSIKSLGLTPDWAMASTKGPNDVAWFKLGKRPGENGSAVIAGHYGIFKNWAISVFNKLHTLRKGDKIYVKDTKWTTISFIVRESKMYDKNANVPEVFSSNDGKAHLNLITCVFDPVSKTYPKRLIVFTDRE